MGLFCGKKCKCKNRCKADLRAMGKDAWKGCQAACKSSNPPANGFEYLEGLPRGSQILLESDYRIQEQFQEDLFEANEEGGISPMVLAVMAIVIVMVFLYLKKST